MAISRLASVDVFLNGRLLLPRHLRVIPRAELFGLQVVLLLED